MRSNFQIKNTDEINSSKDDFARATLALGAMIRFLLDYQALRGMLDKTRGRCLTRS